MATKAANKPQELETNEGVVNETPPKRKTKARTNKTIAQSNAGEQDPTIEAAVTPEAPPEPAVVPDQPAATAAVDTDIPAFEPKPAKPVTFGYYVSNFFRNSNKVEDTMLKNNNPVDFLILALSYIVLVGVYMPIALYKGVDSLLVNLLKMGASFYYYDGMQSVQSDLGLSYGAFFGVGLLVGLIVIALLSLVWMLFGYRNDNKGGYLTALSGFTVSLWPTIICLVIAVITSIFSFGIGFFFFLTSFLVLLLSSYPRISKNSSKNGMFFTSLYAVAFAVILLIAALVFGLLLQGSAANMLEQFYYLF